MFWRTRLNVLSERELDALLLSVVRSYMGADACEALDHVASVTDGVRARVQFRGWLEGLVEIAASVESAAWMAERMTGQRADAAIGGEVLAELCNTLAGQVKSMLGEGLILEIPVIEPTTTPSMWPAFCRSYRCGDAEFTLVMWDRNPDGAM